ncbi:hypothetical protein GCM10009422_07770 [Brevundimonas kwangchunensis]|uniref:PH domain-containing protein n=1 Tax=Brevundimonas kwangchunensis TaxID=322163 RepID=A0ABN1GNG9_9CAUL
MAAYLLLAVATGLSLYLGQGGVGRYSIYIFLEEPPGSYFLYLVGGVLALGLLRELPAFVRAVVRIPAVQFDGRTLLVRGWDNHAFDTVEDSSIWHSINDAGSVITIGSGKGAKARIYTKQVEGHLSLLRFLDDLLGPRAET